jgi:hypothetical protein
VASSAEFDGPGVGPHVCHGRMMPLNLFHSPKLVEIRAQLLDSDIDPALLAAPVESEGA